jgi:EAL domain-containing protein (putative c-di-GMP-specific phosphodiesterase class I)
MDIVAEGIETGDHEGFLREEGCPPHGQGFALGKPMPGDEIRKLLRASPLGH